MILLFDFLSILSTNILIFSLLWSFFYFKGKISWVDFCWSSSIGIWSLVHAYEAKNTLQSESLFALSMIVFFWSFRLSTHLFFRTLLSKGEDRRYEEIKRKTPTKAWSKKTLFIFLMNAALVSILLVPQRILAYADSPSITLWQAFASALCLLAIAGESLADSQLKKHLLLKSNTTCQKGLWKYSRHPNYFFEWLFWVAVYLFTIKAPYSQWALSAPVLMFIFLNYFTGIKISEKNAELRRKDFAEYKKKTSAFFLFFPKKNSSIRHNFD
ncbi:MAG: DUF1295 domain-containing protein [Bdellovibrionota bacterium]